MKTHVVYRFLDSAGQVLYVGRTCNLERRVSHHSEKAWWPQVARTVIRQCATKSNAVRVERLLIQQHRPAHNKVHNPDWADSGKLDRSEIVQRVLDICGAAELASSLGINRIGVYKWTRIPDDRCIQIEKLTGISREELRPDVFVWNPPLVMDISESLDDRAARKTPGRSDKRTVSITTTREPSWQKT